MNHKTSIGIIGIFIIVAVFFAGSQLFYHPKYYTDEYVELTDGWKVQGKVEQENANLQELLLPHMNEGDQLILSRVLPACEVKSPTFRIYTIHSAIRVYLEEELLYEYGHDRLEKGKMLGYGYQMIDLPQNFAGKTLMIVLDVSENNAFTNVDVPVLCNATDAVRSIAIEVRFPLAVNLFLLIFGFFVSMSSILLFSNKRTFGKLASIGTFSIIVAVWSFCNYDAVFVFTDNLLIKAYAEFSAIYLAAIPFMLYFYDDIRKKNKILKKAYDAIFCVQIIFTIVVFMLHVFHILHLPHLIYGEHAILLIIAAFLMTVQVYDLIKRQRKHVVLVIGMVTFLLAGIFDIVHFNVQKFLPVLINVHYQSVMYIGTLAFVFSQILDFVDEISEHVRERVKTETLEKMAYTDYLTGIANRRKCEEEMARLDAGEENYAIFSFDLNNLKITNDTLGHAAGDEMICRFADIMKETFKGSALVGRVGGDEFIAIISKADYVELNQYIEEMNRRINLAMRQEHSYDLSMAYGFCEKREYRDLDVMGIYRKADARMYDMKIRMKYEK